MSISVCADSLHGKMWHDSWLTASKTGWARDRNVLGVISFIFSPSRVTSHLDCLIPSPRTSQTIIIPTLISCHFAIVGLFDGVISLIHYLFEDVCALRALCALSSEWLALKIALIKLKLCIHRYHIQPTPYSCVSRTAWKCTGHCAVTSHSSSFPWNLNS